MGMTTLTTFAWNNVVRKYLMCVENVTIDESGWFKIHTLCGIVVLMGKHRHMYRLWNFR